MEMYRKIELGRSYGGVDPVELGRALMLDRARIFRARPKSRAPYYVDRADPRQHRIENILSFLHLL